MCTSHLHRSGGSFGQPNFQFFPVAVSFPCRAIPPSWEVPQTAARAACHGKEPSARAVLHLKLLQPLSPDLLRAAASPSALPRASGFWLDMFVHFFVSSHRRDAPIQPWLFAQASQSKCQVPRNWLSFKS